MCPHATQHVNPRAFAVSSHETRREGRGLLNASSGHGQTDQSRSEVTSLGMREKRSLVVEGWQSYRGGTILRDERWAARLGGGGSKMGRAGQGRATSYQITGVLASA